MFLLAFVHSVQRAINDSEARSAAGMKKLDVSILSDEFLQEVRGMEYKNVDWNF